MNIFALDDDPALAARALHDRHIVKMALETAQILCTVAHGLGLPAPYKPPHKNHPCTVWAGTTRGKAADQCPDGPQYKAYGNSMAVPVISYLAKRIEATR